MTEDDDEIVETLLGELSNNPIGGGSKKKQVQKRGSGFMLGDLKDPDISLIEKAEDDDPNQLFSQRAAIVNVPEETS